MSEVKVQEFFELEFPNFAMYNLYRMVGSYVDGLKPSQRKIVHTLAKSNITSPIKVSQLASKVSQVTQYLHGEMNLQGVIVNMAQDFSGTNNINLLSPEGSFGNRCFPSAAAARYIYTHKSSSFDSIFRSIDNDILTPQVFEGDVIEPKFFMPILPMLLVNGSEGIGSGWSQKILPRDPKAIKQAIISYLKNGKLPERIAPWWKEFKGTVKHIEDNAWEVSGLLKKVNTTTLLIEEIPPNVSLDKFVTHLTKLEDNRTIESFNDYSDPGTNTFKFEVKVKRSLTSSKTLEQMKGILKITRRISENYTSIDENNTVREFKSEVEILKAFCDIRFKYYHIRKQHIIKDMNSELLVLQSKLKFIQHIITNKLKIKDLTKSEIINYLDGFEDFVKVNRSYNYLLNMPIYSISKEQFEKLQKELEKTKNEIIEVEQTTEADMWSADLKIIK